MGRSSSSVVVVIATMALLLPCFLTLIIPSNAGQAIGRMAELVAPHVWHAARYAGNRLLESARQYLVTQSDPGGTAEHPVCSAKDFLNPGQAAAVPNHIFMAYPVAVQEALQRLDTSSHGVIQNFVITNEKRFDGLSQYILVGIVPKAKDVTVQQAREHGEIIRAAMMENYRGEGYRKREIRGATDRILIICEMKGI